MGIFYLHDDVLHNILVRVSAECLGQLKCVSKSWNALISSQKFIKSHLHHHSIIVQKNPNILVRKFLSREKEIYIIEFPITGGYNSRPLFDLSEFLDPRTIEDVVGCFNGLLCLLLEHNRLRCEICSFEFKCHLVDGYVFALFNPVTKSIWNLPGNPFFDKDQSLCGFWYDDVIDDYKVVFVNRVSFDKKGIHEFHCHVYSLRSNSWGCIHSFLEFTYFTISKFHLVMVNCALYCLIPDGDDPTKHMKRFILAIDLRTYKSMILPLPEAARKVPFLCILALNGHLVLCDGFTHDDPNSPYALWVKKDYGTNDSWTKITIQRNCNHRLEPLALSENGNHKRILSYSMSNKMFQFDEIGDLDVPQDLDGVGSIWIRAPDFLCYGIKDGFVGSLVQPYPSSVGYESRSSGDWSENKMDGNSMIKKQILNAPNQFHIHVNGESIDSQLPKNVLQKYYELCCIKKSFLHERLVPGVSSTLAARMIDKTVYIADSARSCKFSTAPKKHIEDWGKSLRCFELLGMNVGFLRDRVRLLFTLAFDSDEAIEAKKYWEVESKKVKREMDIELHEKDIKRLKKDIERHEDMKCLIKNVAGLRKEVKKYSVEMNRLKRKAKSYELMFEEETSKLYDQ